MIKQTENLKHKTMLMLVYGMGLRVSEIINLEITNIDSKRMQVHIQGAKGKKDAIWLIWDAKGTKRYEMQ